MRRRFFVLSFLELWDELKYRTLFESSADVLFLIDAETLKIMTYNNAAIDLYQFERKGDFIRMYPNDISPPFQPDVYENDSSEE